MGEKQNIEITKNDLLAAWTVLENLAVSFDQIGGAFGAADGDANGAERQRAIEEALVSYITPELVGAINDARMRLGQYVSDAEAETQSEQIAYWEYETTTPLAAKNV